MLRLFLAGVVLASVCNGYTRRNIHSPIVDSYFDDDIGDTYPEELLDRDLDEYGYDEPDLLESLRSTEKIAPSKPFFRELEEYLELPDRQIFSSPIGVSTYTSTFTSTYISTYTTASSDNSPTSSSGPISTSLYSSSMTNHHSTPYLTSSATTYSKSPPTSHTAYSTDYSTASTTGTTYSAPHTSYSTDHGSSSYSGHTGVPHSVSSHSWTYSSTDIHPTISSTWMPRPTAVHVDEQAPWFPIPSQVLQSACFEFPRLLIKYMAGFPVGVAVKDMALHSGSFDDYIKKSLSIFNILKDAESSAKQLVVMVADRIIKEKSACPTSVLDRIVVYTLSSIFKSVSEDHHGMGGIEADLSAAHHDPHAASMHLMRGLQRNLTRNLVKRIGHNSLMGLRKFSEMVYKDAVSQFSKKSTNVQNLRDIISQHLSHAPHVLQCGDSHKSREFYMHLKDSLYLKFRKGHIDDLLDMFLPRHELPYYVRHQLALYVKKLIEHIFVVIHNVLEAIVDGDVQNLNAKAYVLDDLQMDELKKVLGFLHWIHDVTGKDNVMHVIEKDQQHELSKLKSIAKYLVDGHHQSHLNLVRLKIASLLSSKCRKLTKQGVYNPMCHPH